MGRVGTMVQQSLDHVTVTIFDGGDERGHTVLVFLFDEVGGGGLCKDLGNPVEVAIRRCLEEVREHNEERVRS
jgi:hypothetical protein